MPIQLPPDLPRELGTIFLRQLLLAVLEQQRLCPTGYQYPLRKVANTVMADLPPPVQVRNDSGADLDAFSVLGVDGPLADPEDDLTDFQKVIILKGVKPAIATHKGKFVVTLIPLKKGALGPCAEAGIVQVQVNVLDETPARNFAEIDDGVTDNLDAASSGSASILWRQSGTGLRWAIVRLGDPSGTRVPLLQATDDSGTVAPLANNGTVGTGVALVPPTEIAPGCRLREGDMATVLSDKDGNPSIVPLRGLVSTPLVLDGGTGTGQFADTRTWDITSAATEHPDTYGVIVTWTRTYWSIDGLTGPYIFARNGTFDTQGRLVAVSAEIQYQIGLVP